jgi:hypothetical protein
MSTETIINNQAPNNAAQSHTQSEPQHQSAEQQGQNIRKGGYKPDVYIQLVTREGDKTYWEDIGAAWNKKDGYSMGKLDGNREIVIQSREAREAALAKIRSRKQEASIEIESDPTPSM